MSSRSLRFTLTWGLGGMGLVLVLTQAVTGLLLRLAYEPQPIAAYNALQYLENEIFFGPLVRNLHHWSGHLLIAVLFLHMARIFYHRAFLGIRRGNWLVGLSLGLLVCMANFTGYLLPWDQLSYWAVTIATSMLGFIPLIGEHLQDLSRGGPEVGPPTLLLFYNLHTGVLPLLLFLLLAFHFWLIRKAGGISNGVAEDRVVGRVPANPNLFQRELAMTGVVLAGILLAAVLFSPGLLPMADPELTPDTIRAPWYFVGFQEMLLHLSPLSAWSVLACVLLFLCTLPLFPMKNRYCFVPVCCLFTLLIVSYAFLTVIGLFFRGAAMHFTPPW